MAKKVVHCSKRFKQFLCTKAMMAALSSSSSLEIYKTLWGVTEPLKDLLPKLKDQGYAGVEACFLYTSAEDKSLILHAIKNSVIRIVIMVQTSGTTVQEHLESLEQQIIEAISYHPAKLNIHGGEDCWSDSEVHEYFTGFRALEQKYSGVVMLHETHRGRILYSPWSSLKVMEAFPSLQFTADLSHWVVVAERHLEGFERAMSLLAERTRHIHTRPCSPQHIQLADMNDPLYQDDLSKFKEYWRRIIVTQLRLGNGLPSIDPELGPYPYKISTRSGTESNGTEAASSNVDEHLAKKIRPDTQPNGTSNEEVVNSGLDGQLALLVQIVRQLQDEISHSSS